MLFKLCIDILHSKLVMPRDFGVNKSKVKVTACDLLYRNSSWLKFLCKLAFDHIDSIMLRLIIFKLVLPRELGVTRSKVKVIVTFL